METSNGGGFCNIPLITELVITVGYVGYTVVRRVDGTHNIQASRD